MPRARTIAWTVSLALFFAIFGYADWRFERERRLDAEMTGSEPEVFAKLAERCVTWVQKQPEPGSVAEFPTNGLIGAEAENGWPVFSNADRTIFIKLQPKDRENYSCTVADQFTPWTLAQRELVEAHVISLVPDFMPTKYQSLDLREKTGFKIHQIYRPYGDEGRFLMLARTALEQDLPFTFVTIGHGTFEKGGENA